MSLIKPYAVLNIGALDYLTASVNLTRVKTRFRIIRESFSLSEKSTWEPLHSYAKDTIRSSFTTSGYKY